MYLLDDYDKGLYDFTTWDNLRWGKLRDGKNTWRITGGTPILGNLHRTAWVWSKIVQKTALRLHQRRLWLFQLSRQQLRSCSWWFPWCPPVEKRVRAGMKWGAKFGQHENMEGPQNWWSTPVRSAPFVVFGWPKMYSYPRRIPLKGQHYIKTIWIRCPFRGNILRLKHHEIWWNMMKSANDVPVLYSKKHPQIHWILRTSASPGPSPWEMPQRLAATARRIVIVTIVVVIIVIVRILSCTKMI